MIWLVFALGCGSTEPLENPPADAVAEDVDDWMISLSDDKLLRRMSIDLHGRPPTAEAIETLREKTKSLDWLRDEMLNDPDLEEGIIHMLTEPWNTQTEDYQLSPVLLDLADEEHQDYFRSIGEEPLRVAAHVVSTQRPWSDVVTLDYTMSTELLLDLFPLESDDSIDHNGDPDWFPARYIDNRPSLGVIGTNGFGWRFDQAPYGRSRASAISRLFLCHDFLQRPVEFSGASLIEFDELQEATQTVPSCQNCHSALDPLASATFGFEGQEGYSLQDSATYHPERERMGVYYLGAEPGWFGVPIEAVGDLGWFLAEDPRMTTCAVEQFTEAMLHRDTDLLDVPELTERTEAFVDNGELVHMMLAEITDSSEYRAGALTDDAPAWLVERVATRRMMSPGQVADAIEHLTEYRWMEAGWDQMENDQLGFRVMSGGIQPPNILTLGTNPTSMQSLVLKQLAQLAADHVVARDLDASDPLLLTIATLETTPDHPEFEAQLTELAWRMYSEPPTEAELSELSGLWQDLDAVATPPEQWSVLLSVMIRDPRFWTY